MNVLVHLHWRGYAKTTLEGISKKLRQIARNTDLAYPEQVFAYIDSQKSPNTKILIANAYNHYAIFYKIPWEEPVYRKSEAPTKVPLEENLDYIIGTSKSLRRKVAYGILKDLGIRPTELHNLTLENIDLK